MAQGTLRACQVRSVLPRSEYMLCFLQVCTDAALAVALASAAEPAPNAARPTPARAARAVAMQFGKVQRHDTNAHCAHAHQSCCMLHSLPCACQLIQDSTRNPRGLTSKYSVSCTE
jgi:hypothetical protein